jgi:hypothetical protein
MNVCSEKNLQKITVDAIFKCPFDASDKDIL